MAAPGPPPDRDRGRLVLIVCGLITLGVIAWLLVSLGLGAMNRAPPPDGPSRQPAPDPQPIAYYLARADLARGEDWFRRCAACHTIAGGGPRGLGPNLWGVAGGPIAAKPDFPYSEALRSRGGRWDWETLSRFLRDPDAFAPGTRMFFIGVRNPQDRADVMLYLNSQGGSLPMPAHVAGPPPAVTREFLIGNWATDSCDSLSATWLADGTTDRGRRRWTLDGDRLIVTGGSGREQSVVERLGDDRLRLNTGAGTFELHRCPYL